MDELPGLTMAVISVFHFCFSYKKNFKSKEKLSKQKPQEKLCDYIDLEASVDKLPDLTPALVALISVFHLCFSNNNKSKQKCTKIYDYIVFEASVPSLTMALICFPFLL